MYDESSVSSSQLILSGALLAGVVYNPVPWPAAAVRAGLASLTLVDFRPTAQIQLREAQAAIDAAASSDLAGRKQWRERSGPAAVARWAQLVRGKVLGEVLGLSVAVRAPCLGACLLLLSHVAFWLAGAARLRVDKTAKPAPLPAPLARMILTADAVVLAFSALGAFGPTPLLRSAGAGLFAAAAAFVSAEQIPKILKRRRDSDAAAITPPTLEDLPDISVKG